MITATNLIYTPDSRVARGEVIEFTIDQYRAFVVRMLEPAQLLSLANSYDYMNMRPTVDGFRQWLVDKGYASNLPIDINEDEIDDNYELLRFGWANE